MTFNRLIQDISAGKIQPVYFLQGDEPWYIDRVADHLADHVLTDEEKAFNLQVLYGKDTQMAAVVMAARRFPMMSRYQVIIVKEAQLMGKLEGLEHYLSSPLATTVLVFCYKYKKLDKRSKVAKMIAEKYVLFESPRIREDKVPDWITSYLGEKGYQIEPKAAWLMVEYLGSELDKVANELNKMMLSADGNSKQITSSMVESNIGISKDYNNFELTKALAAGDVLKANRIIRYFERNPKNNPIVLTLSSMFYYFSKILLVHANKGKNRNELAREVGVPPFFVPEYEQASRKFTPARTREIISMLREYDVKSKGLGSMAPDGELLKELVYKIMH